VAVILKIG